MARRRGAHAGTTVALLLPIIRRQPVGAGDEDRPRLPAFFAVAFAWSWTCWLLTPAIRAQSALAAGVLFCLGGFGPAVAAVVGYGGGRAALRAWLRRCLQWRIGWRWFALVFFLPLVLMGLAAAIHTALGGTLRASPAAAGGGEPGVDPAAGRPAGRGVRLARLRLARPANAARMARLEPAPGRGLGAVAPAVVLRCRHGAGPVAGPARAAGERAAGLATPPCPGGPAFRLQGLTLGTKGRRPFQRSSDLTQPVPLSLNTLPVPKIPDTMGPGISASWRPIAQPVAPKL